jgi:xanthine permease XanP
MSETATASRKPIAMQYMPGDAPPLSIVVGNAFQYIAVVSSFLIYPLIMAREGHLTDLEADNMQAWGMLVLALGTTLQALPRGPIGSGYLAPSVMTAIFLGPSLEAVRIGGLALLSGMTIFGGLVQVALSRVLNHMRALLPPELAGVVVFLVGISNGVVGLRYLLEPSFGGSLPSAADWVVAALTLGVMAGTNVWSKGVIGLSCGLIGTAVGYLAAIPLGVLPWESLVEMAHLPLVSAPGTAQIGWSFSPALILPFTIAALANGLKGAALLTASQRMLDDDWKRPDMKPISRGVLADGLTVIAAGVCSVFAVNISASSVGLTAATGVASRRVAYATSAIFVAMAFLPMFTRFLVLTPNPVVGATLLFSSCAILKSGMEAITSRIYDSRKTLVVGLSIMAGVGVEAFPAAFTHMPQWIHPLTLSALVFGTAVGFLLNLCFRIGLRQRTVIALDPEAPDLEALARFIETQGAVWGAMRDVVKKAEWAAQELTDTVVYYCNPRGPMELSVSFDEFNLNVELQYAGDILPVVEHRPTPDEIAELDDGATRLAAYLLRRTASTMSTKIRGARCVVDLRFEH